MCWFAVSMHAGGWMFIYRTWHWHTHTDAKLQLLVVSHGEWKWLIEQHQQHRTNCQPDDKHSFTSRRERRVCAPPQGQAASLQVQVWGWRYAWQPWCCWCFVTDVRKKKKSCRCSVLFTRKSMLLTCNQKCLSIIKSPCKTVSLF